MRRRYRTRKGTTLNVPGLAFIFVIFIVWQVVVSSGMITFQYLPAPSAIFAKMFTLTTSGQLPRDLLHTFIACVVGWLAGSVLGIVFGTILGLSRRSWVNSMASVEVMRALPAIAFVPVAVLLLGFSLSMEFLVTTYVAIWPVLVNTIDGVRSETDAHRELAEMMRMSSLERLSKIVFPSAAPTIYVGLRLSLSLSLALAVVAEMVGNPTGVGYALVTFQQALQPASMFAYIVVIGILGVLLNASFVFLSRRLTPGISTLAEKLEE